MKKVEAPTLEAAYAKASKVLECSISELQCEVVQHPNNGILGFFKKSAIIVATCKNEKSKNNNPSKNNIEKSKLSNKVVLPSEEESVANEIIEVVKENVDVSPTDINVKKDTVVDSFFDVDTKTDVTDTEVVYEEDVVYDELALHIENQLKELLSYSCFDIDVVEVDVIDNTALIFIDGEDAALLIGKEGYRYNALSYMLFNWLHTQYELFIKLEIAEFLTTQQEMIRNYIQPVIENVEKQGKGKTRFLDGILVQIALEQLRERFPDKYVAVKTGREGKKFVVINEFNNPNPSKSHT
jgi:spoIIIJ-associated protein